MDFIIIFYIVFLFFNLIYNGNKLYILLNSNVIYRTIARLLLFCKNKLKLFKFLAFYMNYIRRVNVLNEGNAMHVQQENQFIIYFI